MAYRGIAASYEDRDRRRRSLLASLTVGTVASAVIFRQELARGLLRGGEILGNRLLRFARPTGGGTLEQTVRSFQHQMDRTVRNQIASDLRIGVFQKKLQGFGWAGRDIEELLAANTRAEDWVNPAGERVATLFGHRGYRDLRSRLLQRTDLEVLHGHLAAAREAAASLQIPTFGPRGLWPEAFLDLRRELSDQFLRHLEETSTRPASPFLRALGIERPELGLGPRSERLLSRIRPYLTPEQELRAATLVPRLRDRHVFQSGERIYNLSDLHTVAMGGLEWLRTHVVLPIAPGIFPIKPFTLFPWLSGRTTEVFKTASPLSRQMAAAAALGQKAHDPLGYRIFATGKQALAVGARWTEEGAEIEVRNLGGGWDFRDLQGGFWRGLYESLLQHGAATRDGPVPRNLKTLLSLGQTEESKFSRVASIFRKFEDESYAPTALRNLLRDEPKRDLSQRTLQETITADDLYRVGKVLGILEEESRQAPVSVLARHARRDPKNLPESFVRALQHPEEESAILDFLQDAMRDFEGEGDPPFLSPALEQVLADYRLNPREFLRRQQHRPPRGIYNLGRSMLGGEDPFTGVDQVRRALADEMLQWDPGALTAALADPELKEGQQRALRALRDYGRLMTAQREEGAAGVIRTLFYEQPGQEFRGAEILENLEDLVRQHWKPWHAHSAPQEVNPQARWLMLREGESLWDTAQQAKAEGWGLADWWNSRFVRQYRAFFQGMKDPDAFTTTSAIHYWFALRLHQGIGDVGLGLAPQDLGSGADILKGLILKRILPGVAAYEALQYADEAAETLGLPGPTQIRANARARVSLALARFRPDLDVFPGLENYFSDRNVEEEKRYLAHGYDEVRRGRWWLFGSSTPFYGTNTQYWIPNYYRLAHSGWKSASNVDQGGPDYWAHHWLPTPTHPLAPLKHFLDPRWWERKHAEGDQADRPYVISSPLFDPATPWGGLLNTTVGRVLKPTRVLHPEYLPENLPETLASEERQLSAARSAVADLNAGGSEAITGGKTRRGASLGRGAVRAVNARLASGGSASPLTLARVTGGGEIQLRELDPALLPSGAERRGASLSRSEIAAINRRLMAGESGLRPLSNYREESRYSADQLARVSRGGGLLSALESARDLGGIYNFFLRTVTPETSRETLATAQDALGYSRRFYETGLGGLGGDLSEIGRRFLRRRKAGERLYNPVPNSMPDWLPNAQQYFLDFGRGDPYCVSAGTLVETAEGPKPAAEVQPGELVLTHRGEYRAVTARAVRPVGEEERVYRIRVAGVVGPETLLSEDHPVLTLRFRRRWRYNRWRYRPRWTPAGSLRPGDWALYPAPTLPGKVPTLDFGQGLEGGVATDRWIYPARFRPLSLQALERLEAEGRLPRGAFSRSAARYAYRVLSGRKPRPRRLPRHQTLTPDLAWLLGCFYAGGRLPDREKHPRVLLHLPQPRDAQRARDLFWIYFRAVFEEQERPGGGRMLCRGDQFLHGIFRALFRERDGELRIPEAIFESREDLAEAFLEGVLAVRGQPQSAGIRVQHPRARWILELRRLALALRITTTVDLRTTPRLRLLRTSLVASRPELYRRICEHQGFPPDLTPGRERNAQQRWFGRYLCCRVLAVEPVEGVEEVYGFEQAEDRSFCVLGVATHNTTVPRGELRLPGEAYRRAHGTKILQMRASALGGSLEDLVNHFLGRREPMSDFGEYVTEFGDEAHLKVQKAFQAQGVLRGAEVEVYDEKLGISGHIDLVLEQDGRPVLGEIKTMSARRWETEEPYSEHRDQLLFYEHVTGVHQGFLAYVDREDPSRVKLFDVAYDPQRFRRIVDKVEAARDVTRRLVDQGYVTEGDLYPKIDRYEILADVAPWSPEFRQLGSELAHDDQLSDFDRWRYQEAKRRASRTRHKKRLYPLIFHQESERRSYRVAKILSASQVLTTAGDVLKLAGGDVSLERAQDALGVTTPAELWKSVGIQPGTRISAVVNPERQRDVTRSYKASISVWGRNVNRLLRDRGILEEDEDQITAADVDARFTGLQRWIGSVWETFAHTDTPFHSKFLRVRTGLEEYERSQVFGKEGGGWSHPFRDHLLPAIHGYVSRDPVAAGLGMGFLAASFFDLRSQKLRAAGWVGSAAALYSLGHTLFGGPEIPLRVQQRRELEEYFDKLEYVKHRRLAAEAERRAAREEGIHLSEEEEGSDVGEIFLSARRIGGWRRAQLRRLARRKRRLTLDGERKHRREIREIRAKMERLAETQRAFLLGPWATAAVQERQAVARTLYAQREGSPVRNILAALPKYEREIAAEVLQHGSERERLRFARLLPREEQRVLGPLLGLRKLPERQTLGEYFKTHQLPGPDWRGWDPAVDLEQVKIVAAKQIGLDPIDIGAFPQQVEEAEIATQDVGTPVLDHPTHGLRRRLNQLLSGLGLSDLEVSVRPIPSRQSGFSVQLQLAQDRHDHLIQALNDPAFHAALVGGLH